LNDSKTICLPVLNRHGSYAFHLPLSDVFTFLPRHACRHFEQDRIDHIQNPLLTRISITVHHITKVPETTTLSETFWGAIAN